ncbi:MAG: DUF3982 domain-containing protein [Oscillospiraceae bacterium]|nr:DUF3982 domain-containing protein [Oscillospiraceae bacterium]
MPPAAANPTPNGAHPENVSALASKYPITNRSSNCAARRSPG